MRYLRGGLLGLALLSAACAPLRSGPWVLDSASVGARPVARAAWVASWPQALSTVLDVFTRRLGLPAPEVRLVFLPDDRAFESMLREIGYPADLARDTTATMTAIGGHRNVLVNEGRLRDDEWPARVALLAHELTHVLQYELGGGTRGASDQWLREGFADWVELAVLVELGAVDAVSARAEHLRRLRPARPRLPALASLDTFPAWVAANRRADVDLYSQAQMAVDLLVERHGVARVLEYFRRFADRQERLANFEATFGESLVSFDQAFSAHLGGRR